MAEYREAAIKLVAAQYMGGGPHVAEIVRGMSADAPFSCEDAAVQSWVRETERRLEAEALIRQMLTVLKEDSPTPIYEAAIDAAERFLEGK